MSKKQKIMNRLFDHAVKAEKFLETKNLHAGKDYELSYIALQGSQNYETDHEGSDVDSRLMITPTMTTLLLKKDLTFDFKMENGEICVIRNTMDALEPLFKGNVNGMEVLFTEYFTYLGNPSFNPWRYLRYMADTFPVFFETELLKASLGMMKQKQASMLKPTGGSQEEFFNRYGYNSKDFIHIHRLRDMIQGTIAGTPFRDNMKWGKDGWVQKFLSYTREGAFTKEHAISSASLAIGATEVTVQNYLEGKDTPELREHKNRLKENIRIQVAEEIVR